MSCDTAAHAQDHRNTPSRTYCANARAAGPLLDGKCRLIAKFGSASMPVSVSRMSRSAGTVDASQAVIARSLLTVAVVASMLPLSNTLRHSRFFSRSACRTTGLNAQDSATIETGNGRFRCAVPLSRAHPDQPFDPQAFARRFVRGGFYDCKVERTAGKRLGELRRRCAHERYLHIGAGFRERLEDGREARG